MPPRLAILIYGNQDSGRDALTEEKYKELADAFNKQYTVESVLYSDEQAGQLSEDLKKYDAVLVWVNPIEQGNDRSNLDSLLTKVSEAGTFVSTHPDIIMKMGTKDILLRPGTWPGEATLKCIPTLTISKGHSLQN